MSPRVGSTAADQRQGPIFIFADDDRGAIDRILERLHTEWYYVPVVNPRLVLKYAKRIGTTAIFLADPVEYPRGGAAALLQRLIDEVGKPVIILTENWTPESAELWKRMGATDCLPHPTRFDRRIERLRAKMQELSVSGSSPRLTSEASESKP